MLKQMRKWLNTFLKAIKDGRMKIEIKTKWLRIITETSRRQIVVVAILVLATLQIINMFTTKYDTNLFQWIIYAIMTLAGYEYGRRTANKKKTKAKTQVTVQDTTS